MQIDIRNYFGIKEFFLANFVSKMNVKMNLRIITKNHAADSKIGFLLKIVFRADWTHESNPTAWELNTSERKNEVQILLEVIQEREVRNVSFDKHCLSFSFMIFPDPTALEFFCKKR